jgi:hypothetical protein
VVFGDVVVRHPATGVGEVQQQVKHLAGPDEDGVGPDEVGLDDAVAGENEEASGSVDVERVVSSSGRSGRKAPRELRAGHVSNLEQP